MHRHLRLHNVLVEVEEAIVKFTAVGTTYRIMQAVGRLGERQKVPVIRRSLNNIESIITTE